MAKSKAAKVELGKELGEKFSRAKGAVVAQYSGMTAEDLTSLRREMRSAGCEFKVMKNRVAKKAIDQSLPTAAAFKEKLVGPIGVIYINKDVAAGAKAIIKFSKEKEIFKLTSALLEGQVTPITELQAIADLPSKEVLLTQIVSSLVAPHRRLLGALNGVAGNLVRVISAIKDKKTS